MIYGAIDEKGEKFYTYLDKVFDAIGNRQREYNWLITDCFCNMNNSVTKAVDSQGYCWIDGKELTDLVRRQHCQWIFAVLSGFHKDVSLSQVLKGELPYADGYGGFWKLPLTMQHPLAQIEIVPWDSTLTLIFSRDQDIIGDFRRAYPQSEDLKDYIVKFQ